MGRFKAAATDDSDDQQIDISPLIDVVFILLIFFIVATTFVEERGVSADKPDAAPATESEENETLVFTLSEAGDVLFEGEAVGLGGVQTIIRNVGPGEEKPVIIQTEDQAPHGLLVRMMDEAQLAGATRITLNNAP